MDTKEQKFEEQNHPLKNTDHAFVQVGKNGEPVIPKVEENQGEEKTDSYPSPTSSNR